jgi:hypothetical protein
MLNILALWEPKPMGLWSALGDQHGCNKIKTTSRPHTRQGSTLLTRKHPQGPISCQERVYKKLDEVVHAINPCTQKQRQADLWVQGQPGLHSEVLSFFSPIFWDRVSLCSPGQMHLKNNHLHGAEGIRFLGSSLCGNEVGWSCELYSWSIWAGSNISLWSL